MRQNKNTPVILGLHNNWNEEWDMFFKRWEKIASTQGKRVTKDHVMKHLSFLQRKYSNLLRGGRQARMSYAEWRAGTRQIGDNIVKLKKYATANKTSAYRIVKIVGKSAKAVSFVLIVYDIKTNGVSVAAENAISDLTFPASMVIEDGIRRFNGLYDKNISIGKSFRGDAIKEVEERLNSNEFNSEVFRPRIYIPIK